MKKIFVTLGAAMLFFTANVLAAGSSQLVELQKACANLPTLCKSVDVTENIYTLTCKNGSKNYIYPPAAHANNANGLVSTDQPNTGSYWCVPNYAQHLHPENMIKAYCKQ